MLMRFSLSFFLSLSFFFFFSFLILLITSDPGENSPHSPPLGQTYFLCERHFLRGGVEQTAACSPLCRFVPRSAAADPAGTERPRGEASPQYTSRRRAEQSRAEPGAGGGAEHGRWVLRAAAGMRSPERPPR